MLRGNGCKTGPRKIRFSSRRYGYGLHYIDGLICIATELDRGDQLTPPRGLVIKLVQNSNFIILEHISIVVHISSFVLHPFIH